MMRCIKAKILAFYSTETGCTASSRVVVLSCHTFAPWTNPSENSIVVICKHALDQQLLQRLAHDAVL